MEFWGVLRGLRRGLGGSNGSYRVLRVYRCRRMGGSGPPLTDTGSLGGVPGRDILGGTES